MDFQSTYPLESESLPGVVVTLRRIGPRERGAIELSLAAARARQREISLRHETARQKLDEAIAASPRDEEGAPIERDLSPEVLALALDVQGINAELDALVRSQITPAYIKAAVEGFGGDEPLTYGGKPATAELLCQFGPDGLFDETVAAINANGYLPAAAARNLSSPSTSGAPVAGEPTNSTAPAASVDGSISSETASPDTPST